MITFIISWTEDTSALIFIAFLYPLDCVMYCVVSPIYFFIYLFAVSSICFVFFFILGTTDAN